MNKTFSQRLNDLAWSLLELLLAILDALYTREIIWGVIGFIKSADRLVGRTAEWTDKTAKERPIFGFFWSLWTLVLMLLGSWKLFELLGYL